MRDEFLWVEKYRPQTIEDCILPENIKKTFNGLNSNKKAKILNNKLEIFNLIDKDLNNNDYLMIKGSNSTDLHKITKNLKQRVSHVI